MSNAKVSINRTNSNQRDTDFISITIEDRLSGRQIIRVEMEMEHFGAAITGLSSMPAVYNYVMTPEVAALIGKVRETKHALIDRVEFKMTSEQVKEGIESELVDGWQLFDDGTGTQQPNKDKHKAILIRYVDAEGE